MSRCDPNQLTRARSKLAMHDLQHSGVSSIMCAENRARYALRSQARLLHIQKQVWLFYAASALPLDIHSGYQVPPSAEPDKICMLGSGVCHIHHANQLLTHSPRRPRSTIHPIQLSVIDFFPNYLPILRSLLYTQELRNLIQSDNSTLGRRCVHDCSKAPACNINRECGCVT
jgi:hypothetical protein